jgi:hypothetical protein
MEPEGISGTSVNFYQTTPRNNPEDSHFHYAVFLEQVYRPLTTFSIPAKMPRLVLHSLSVTMGHIVPIYNAYNLAPCLQMS